MAVLLLSGGLAAAQDAAVDAAPDQVGTEEKRREETIGLWRKLFGGRAGREKGKAEPAFKIDVSVGYATYQAEMKPGRWYPVWVRIEAKKGDAEGVVALTQVENPLEVEVPFSVTEGSTKIYPSYFRPRPNDFDISNAQIDAEVRAKGRRRPETIPLPHPVATPGARHLLILSEERGGFRSLVRRTPDEDEKEDERAGSSPPARRVIYGEPTLLPGNAVALAGVDAIIINGAQVRQITRSRWQALQQWVASGGNLLLAGGRHLPFIEQSNLAGAFGARIKPAEPVGLGALDGATSATSEEAAQTLAAFPADGPEFWDWLWLGDWRTPWIVGKRVGAGSFHYSAIDLAPENIERISRLDGSEALWGRILDREAAPSELDLIAQYGGGVIEKGLQQTFVISLAGLKWVFFYLLLYNALALPLNRWVCRRLKRPDVSWALFLAFALGFAWFGYVSGAQRQRRTFQVNELTLVRRSPGIADARVSTFCVVFSPGKYREDIRADGVFFPEQIAAVLAEDAQQGTYPMPGPWPRPSGMPARPRPWPGPSPRPSPPVSAPVQKIRLAFEGGTQLREFRLFSYDARSYKTDSALENCAGIAVREPLRFQAEGLQAPAGRIVNETPWTFRRSWIGNGSKFWIFHGPWKPGESLDTSEMTVPSGVGGWRNLVENVALAGFGPARSETDAAQASPAAASSSAADAEPSPGWSEADWGPYASRRQSDGGFYFWGETDADFPSLFSNMDAGINVRRVIFEQVLPVLGPLRAQIEDFHTSVSLDGRE